ncbi:MAG: amidohydrolase family protein [bacterium]|nr:amidohydrolase family protein [bacterium]
MTGQHVISADSHVQEPPDLYDRLPKAMRDRAPRRVERDGKTYILVDGRKPRRIDLAESRATEDDQHREFRNDPTGGRDLDLRLNDLARDGVVAEVIYPNQSLGLYMSPEPAYQMAVASAYNDWAIEHFRPHRERFAPVGILPVSNLHAAVVEVERMAKLGYRSVKVPITHRALPYNRPEYEPLWAAIAASGLVLAFHAFTNSEDEYPDDWGEEEGYGGALDFMAMRMADGQSPVSQIISGGVCDRYPELKFVIVECGAGWLAWLLYVLDEQAEKKHMWIQPKLSLRPSEFFARQGFITFTDDPIALHNISFTGADCLLWGSDYPHDEGSFPHSQAVIERTFASLTDDDKGKIVWDNARRLYGFDVIE